MRTRAATAVLGAIGLAVTPLAATPALAAPAPMTRPTRAATLAQTKHADVDGDGRLDLVRIYNAGTKEVSGMEWTTWQVRVRTAAGHSGSVSFGIPTYQTTKPWYGWANIDGARGAELLFLTHSDDGLGFEVLTWQNGKLVREKAPAVPASAYQPGGWFAPYDGNQFGGYTFVNSHGRRLANSWNATCPDADKPGACTVRTVQSVWRSGAWHRVAELARQKVSPQKIRARLPLGSAVVHH